MDQLNLTQQELDAFLHAVIKHCFGQFKSPETSALRKEWLAGISKPFLSVFKQLSLSKVADLGVIHQVVHDVARQPQVPEVFKEIITKAWQDSIEIAFNTQAPLTAGLNKKAFLEAFLLYFGNDHRKARLVHAVVHNAQYQQMISSVIVQVLRQFFQEEALLSKLPGVGQFLRMSKWGVGKVLPQWEQTLEGLAHSFVTRNLQAVLKLSETTLVDSFSEKNILLLGEQVWNYLDERPMGELLMQAGLTEGAIQNWLGLHWSSLTEGVLWEQLMAPLINTWLNAISDITCGQIVVALQIPDEQLALWSEKVVIMLFEVLYQSEEVHEVLNQLLAPCFTVPFLTSVLENLSETNEC